MFTLILAEQRKPVLAILKRLFADDEGVGFTSEPLSDFVLRSDLDALVVTRWLASDRYHETPPVGTSQVISTKGDRYSPPYVVTTPGFPAHVALDETGNGVVVRDVPTITLEQETFIVFSNVFQAIKVFNLAPDHRAIRVLGCDLDLIGIPAARNEQEMLAEMQGIHRAYQAFEEA